MSRRGKVIVIVVALALLVGLSWWVVGFARDLTAKPVAPAAECVVQPDPAVTGTGTVALADSTIAVDALGATSGPTVSPSNNALSLAAVQLQHASTINAVGLRKGVNERARVIAVATALQESSLRNLPSGDLDSIGLFQQRPSQGWGTPAQIGDPVYAAGIFYDRLLQVSSWQSLPLTEAAQAVQYSAHPDAYAKWEPAATTLVRALSQRWYSVVNCRAGATSPTAPTPTRDPVAGAETATPPMVALLGSAQAEMGGLAVLSLTDGGRTALLSASLVDADDATAAAALAAWSVAHATGSAVTVVDVAGHRWADFAWSEVAAGLPDGQVRLTVAG